MALRKSFRQIDEEVIICAYVQPTQEMSGEDKAELLENEKSRIHIKPICTKLGARSLYCDRFLHCIY
ncbi:hypothetical protein TEHIT2_21970 [Tetragenococcus halophilus]|nr:hypothetical protein TEHIT2_21970 [Tetragenococcus halophilus]